MRLYMDDDSTDAVLVRMLRNAGHDVRLPADVGLSGSPDPAHLRRSIHERRVLLSYNHRDFELLHDLVLEAAGHHPGIVIVRRENNPRRDLSRHDVVRAIDNLLASTMPLEDQYVILNHWR